MKRRPSVVSLILAKGAASAVSVRATTQIDLSVREAPTEFQLWRPGDNPTDYGIHVWSERSIREVMARYKSRGNPILLDVEHGGSSTEDGEPNVTAGYARLEVRSGAPWLVFDWSDYGREQIASGQRRFVSPEYDVDKDTGEILALYRVSLVADPGTHRARMLATRGAIMPELSVIMAAIRAALAAEDPAVAKESLTNLMAELEKGGDGGAADVSDVTANDASKSTDDEKKAVETDAADDAKDDKDDKDDKVAAKAKPLKATVKASSTDRVSAAADDAVRVIQNATRDHLMTTQGDKLDPSIRRWASSQPLEVVRGLLDATPAKDTAAKRAKATQGAGGAGAEGLTERERELCASKGIDPAKYAATRAGIKARSNVNGTGV